MQISKQFKRFISDFSNATITGKTILPVVVERKQINNEEVALEPKLPVCNKWAVGNCNCLGFVSNNTDDSLFVILLETIENMQLNKAIKNRWSPRAFSKKPVTKEMIQLLFEAARRAPSSRNEQPWKYYYVHRENQKAFNDIVELLTGNNPDWAKEAQLLIISVLKKNLDYKNRPNGKALHDIGAANISIAIQAAEMGLQAHQMGGYDKEKAAGYLKLDTENFEPVTVFAVGFPDEERQQTEELIKRKIESETRKEIKDFVFEMKDDN